MYTNILHIDSWSIFAILAILIQAIPAVVVLFLVSEASSRCDLTKNPH
jgi:hypothetical protein